MPTITRQGQEMEGAWCPCFRASYRATVTDDAITLLSGKWRAKILCLLDPRPLRTSQIMRAIPSVSSKVLTQTLRRMERDGLIERRTHAGPRLRVEYALTPKGTEAAAHVRTVSQWAIRYRR